MPGHTDRRQSNYTERLEENDYKKSIRYLSQKMAVRVQFSMGGFFPRFHLQSDSEVQLVFYTTDIWELFPWVQAWNWPFISV
jgi:hypothetical protein